MAALTSAIDVAAPLGGVWELYFDESSWPAWVDQLASVVSSRGYPEVGGELVWRSGPAGRGEVRERVTAHSPELRHAIEFEDPSVRGTLATSFAEEGGGTRVSLELAYELRADGVFARVSDVLFARSQMRASLQRSLSGLRLEAEARA